MSSSNLTSQGWKDDRIFTGRDPCYPVELFIELLEGESKIFDFQDQDRLAANAKCLVDVEDFKEDSSCSSWDSLKAALLGSFGRGGTPYSPADHVMLVKSLTKGKVESYNTFYLRVQWVVKSLGSDVDDNWSKLLFLSGLSTADLETMHKADKKNNSLADFCDKFRAQDTVPSVKVEMVDEKPVKPDQSSPEIKQENEGDSDDVDMMVDLVLPPDVAIKTDEEDSDYELSKPLPRVKKKKKTVTTTYHCHKCNKTFQARKEFLDHKLEAHQGSDRYYCGLCKVSCANKEEWDSHEAQNHLGKCSICGIAIHDLKSMQNHHKVNHGSNQTPCPTCSVMIRYCKVGSHTCKQKPANTSMQKSVENRMARKGLRTCVLKEGETVKDVRSMTTHVMGMVEGVTRWYCSYCHQEFADLREIQAHTVSAHQGKKYRCDICPDYQAKCFDNVVHHKLKVHDIVTDTFDLFKCPQCKFKTIRQTDLEWHLKNVHSEERKEDRTCKVCNKELFSASHVQKHVETVHMKLKQIRCNFCDKEFISHYMCRTHMEKHHSAGGPKKAEPVVCNVCGVKLKSEVTLKNHMKWQHGDKTQQECKICGKVSKNLKALEKHIKSGGAIFIRGTVF